MNLEHVFRQINADSCDLFHEQVFNGAGGPSTLHIAMRGAEAAHPINGGQWLAFETGNDTLSEQTPTRSAKRRRATGIDPHLNQRP